MKWDFLQMVSYKPIMFKDEACSGRKLIKESLIFKKRLTFVRIHSSKPQKLPKLVIDKCKNTRCFKHKSHYHTVQIKSQSLDDADIV